MAGYIRELIADWYNLIIAQLACYSDTKSQFAMPRFIEIDASL